MNEDPRRDVVATAIYRALGEYNYQRRLARDLRSILRGRGPTVKRGTARGALALYLTDVALAEVDALEREREGRS